MKLPFFIAKRYLISKKSHNAINIISGISVGGVCIGTMALVIVLSAFNGLSNLVQSLYNSFDADITITLAKGKTFAPDNTLLQNIKQIDGIANYAEVMQGNALLKYKDKQSIATVKGVSESFRQMSGFDSLITDGNFNVSKNNIVIGKGISHILETGPDDVFTPISIFAPKRGNSSSLNPEDGLNELKMYAAGAFSINDEFDYKYVFMSIENARKLLDYPNVVTAIEISVKPSADLEHIQQKLTTLLGANYVIKNREQQNALLYKTLKSEKLWTFIILLFILIIATFNVIGSLTMLIIEKKKDILILNNMGADIRLIRNIFLIEGLLITFIGAVLGLILGVLVCWLQIKFSLIRFSEGYVVDAYPIKILPSDLLLIVSMVFIIGFLAAWYPIRIFTKKHLKA
ncbi:MAG: FtsX-like permease family protein [Bacteroidia bacterium]